MFTDEPVHDTPSNASMGLHGGKNNVYSGFTYVKKYIFIFSPIISKFFLEK